MIVYVGDIYNSFILEKD